MEASVSMACRRLLSGCDGVCGIAAWQNAVLGTGEFSGRLVPARCPAPWVAWIRQSRAAASGRAASIVAAACLDGQAERSSNR